MSIFYHLGKANMVDDDLRSLSMGGTANVEEENRDLAKVVHKLACMGVRLKDEGAPPASWACFDKAFSRHFFPQELREANVFVTLKQDSLSVHKYGLKFNQLFRYALEMVKDMRSRISLFVARLGHSSSNEGRATMLIRGMDVSRLMIYVQ